MKPRVPGYLSLSNHHSNHASRLQNRSETTSTTTSHEGYAARRQRITEFIAQERQVYILQLLINKKLSEIKRLSKTMETEEEKLANREYTIEQQAKLYKKETSQLEIEIANAQKELEITALNKSNLSKKHRMTKQNIEILQSEISQKEELLQTFQTYKNFLRSFDTNDKELLQYFNTPLVLIDELDKIKSHNLFLLRKLDEFNEIDFDNFSNIQTQILETKKSIKTTKENLDKLKYDDNIDVINPQISNNIDKELQRISSLVKKTYFKCFDKSTDFSVITMLQNLENSLEEMYKKLKTISPTFIIEKQNKFDIARRNEKRKLKQTQEIKEQRIRMENIIERSKKPTPKKLNRPLVQRITPCKVKRIDDSKQNAVRKEQERLNQLLYGDLFE